MPREISQVALDDKTLFKYLGGKPNPGLIDLTFSIVKFSPFRISLKYHSTFATFLAGRC